MTYDGRPHGTTGEVYGVNGEDLGPVAITYNTADGGPPVDAGTYTATGTFAGNQDYASATGTALIIIDKANASINVKPYHVTYDGNAHTATGTATGVGGADLSAGLNLTGTTHTNAGDYPSDAWSFAGGTNYNDASGTVHDIIDGAGEVSIWINDTPGNSDNITLFNPPPFALNYTQTIPALITNQGGDGTFQLLVEPEGAATLSQTSVTLAAGASTEVMITPQVVSSAPNDVQIVAMQNGTTVGRDEMTIVSVAMPQDIRNADTPDAMHDRIPPRIPNGARSTSTSVPTSPGAVSS